MEYAIGEFSRLSGIGVHTLRYYEKEGLLSPQRNAANRRRYTERDLLWAAFLLRLKATGMPIQEIRHYAELRALGKSTLGERLALLSRHRESLERQIALLQAHREKLDEKISLYQEEIHRARPTNWNLPG